MRTAKYHDYTVLRIVLFIVLVILGLFVYLNFVGLPHEHTAPDNAWTVVTEPDCDSKGSKCKVCTECGENFGYEAIPETGHTALAPVKENEKPHTNTAGASYDEVTYCKDCGVEVGRETVYVGGKHTLSGANDIIVIEENVKPATCTQPGSHIHTEKCAHCGYVFVDGEFRVDDDHLGHDYAWTLNYDPATKNGSIVGECKRECAEEDHSVTYTTSNGLKVVRDETVSSCCAVRYQGIVDGKPLAYVDFAAEKNHSVTHYPDKDNMNPEDAIVTELPDFKVDWRTGKLYYDLSEVDGIIKLTDSEYDAYGFTRGYFKCAECDKLGCAACEYRVNDVTGELENVNHRFVVYIYNPEYDTYLYPQTNENGQD